MESKSGYPAPPSVSYYVGLVLSRVKEIACAQAVPEKNKKTKKRQRD